MEPASIIADNERWARDRSARNKGARGRRALMSNDPTGNGKTSETRRSVEEEDSLNSLPRGPVGLNVTCGTRNLGFSSQRAFYHTVQTTKGTTNYGGHDHS